MPASAFNADYWVAVATAAPVLALANTVTMSTFARTYLELRTAIQRAELSSGEARPINPLGWMRGYRLVLVNFGLQVLAMGLALISLQERLDVVPPWVTSAAIVVSLLLIAYQASKSGQDSVQRWIAERLAVPLDADDGPQTATTPRYPA